MKSFNSCPALYYKSSDVDTVSTDVSDTSSIVSFSGESVESLQFVNEVPGGQMHKRKENSFTAHLNINEDKMQINSPPKVVGHRGSLYRALENTRHSIRLASEHCHEVEIDVFLLKCGTLIVFHGGGTDQNPGCLKEYCNMDASILDLTYEEARKLKFNPNYLEFGCGPDIINELDHECYIPTLHEVLSDAKETGVVIKIELKNNGAAEPVLNLVEKMDMVDQIHYSSFDHARIKTIRKLRPGRNLDGSYRYKTGALFDELPDNYLDLALDAGASEVHLKYSTCTPEKIRNIHGAGMDSMIWMRGPIGMKDDVSNKFHGVGNEDESMYLAIMKTGVKAMCVNRPDVLSNLLMKLATVKRIS